MTQICHCNDKTISQSVVKIKTKIYGAKDWMLWLKYIIYTLIENQSLVVKTMHH